MNKQYWPRKEHLWVLFDQNNGDPDSQRYIWWFDSRKAAREYEHWQNKVYIGAKLKGPVKFYR